METRKHFGNSVQNVHAALHHQITAKTYCIYCGFNCHNKIRRAKLDMDEIEQELKAIAETGLQEILMLTGEAAPCRRCLISARRSSWHASISASSASRSIR